MKKDEKPLGVTLYAGFIIVGGVIVLVGSIASFNYSPVAITSIILAIPTIIVGAFLLMFKNWARLALIFMVLVAVINKVALTFYHKSGYVSAFLHVLISLVIIYYFTKPVIRSHFNVKKASAKIKILFTGLIFLYLIIMITPYCLAPKILKWYVNKQISDKSILHLAPTEILSNIEKPGYLDTLQTHTFQNFKIALPKDFKLYHEKKKTATFKRMDGDLLSGFILVSFEPSGFFIQLEKMDVKRAEKMKKAGIVNDYDFFTKAISAKKENISNLLDVVFINLKAMIFPRVGDEKNLKIYRYENGSLKGYITSNILDSETDYSCDIFDKESNYFHIMVRTKAPTLSLDEICTIVSTIERQYGR